MNTKLIGLLTVVAVAYTVQDSTASTGTPDIYSESLYMEKSSAEIPGSLAASTGKEAPIAAVVAGKPKAVGVIAKASVQKIKYMSDDDSTPETVDQALGQAPVKKKHKRSL